MQPYSKKLKSLNRGAYIIIGVLLLAAILLIWLVNKSTLILTINPSNSVVTVNNQVLYTDANGMIKEIFSPGTYVLRVDCDNYVSNIQEITLKKAGKLNLNISLKELPKSHTIAELGENGEKIVQDVQFVSEADDFNSIFYFADNASKLYKAKFKLNDENEIETVFNRSISNPLLSGIKDIVWSPNKDAAIFKKDDGVYFFDFKKYNFISQEEVKYGEDIGDIAWSPDDSKIAYYYAPDSGEKSLIFANKTNSEVTRVANFNELSIENPYLKWSPDSEWLIVIPRNSDTNQNKIYLFNAYTRSFKQVTDTGGHKEAMFSPNGEKIIYSTESNDPNHPIDVLVSIMDKNGENKRSLDLRAHIGKIIWFNNDNEKIIVATYDTDKKQEAIFGFDVMKKEKESFVLNLDGKKYVSELSLSRENNLLFYVASKQFYVVELN